MTWIAKSKPCPFCGSDSNFVECMDFGSFAVICNDCGAQGPEADGDDCDPDGDNARGRRKATQAWNRRRRALAKAEGLGQRADATPTNPLSEGRERS